jgi:hypothetical protein
MMRSIDIPQANALETVRQVVHAVDLGVRRLDALADFSGYSIRHTGYRLHAARILGLVRLDGDEASITALGERLLCTDPHTEKERAVFYDAIASSAVIQLLVPDLLSLVPPNTESITERLFQETKLGKVTASRRAGGLLAWRRYVYGDRAPERKIRPSRKPAAINATQGEQLSLF